ncbi:unnamed protein product [Gongylonema pulchrum]|uniref:HRDC domain-containing protein n=1 Tax=Gongylonema pulchrum TaxID=637853 RepID=A0A183E4Y0_9BILA|nr:unnamed protein product [Gongylonema pulchrum]
MFDTQRAMKALDFSKFSYQYLVQACCNRTLDKKLQKADWRLRNRLIEAGNDENNLLKFVYSNSVDICLTQPVFENDGYKSLLVGKKPLNSRQEFALEALWKWRDERARDDDESLQFVLPNHMMLHMAEMLPREMQGILACCSPVPLHVKQELHALHRIISTARDQPLVKRAISAPTIGTLTFENVVSRLNKMDAVKALLRCHLDFSTTKYNEEIRNIAYEKFGGGKDLEGGNKSSNARTASPSPDIYTIGETGVNQESKQRLAKVLKMLEEWATPFECYRITMMEKKSNAMEQETSDGTNLGDGTRCKSEKEVICIEEIMTLTEKERKKKRKREIQAISIPTTSDASANSRRNAEIPEKRTRKPNWTNAAEKCDNQVDYSSLESTVFPKGIF